MRWRPADVDGSPGGAPHSCQAHIGALRASKHCTSSSAPAGGPEHVRGDSPRPLWGATINEVKGHSIVVNEYDLVPTVIFNSLERFLAIRLPPVQLGS